MANCMPDAHELLNQLMKLQTGRVIKKCISISSEREFSNSYKVRRVRIVPVHITPNQSIAIDYF